MVVYDNIKVVIIPLWDCLIESTDKNISVDNDALDGWRWRTGVLERLHDLKNLEHIIVYTNEFRVKYGLVEESKLVQLLEHVCISIEESFEDLLGSESELEASFAYNCGNDEIEQPFPAPDSLLSIYQELGLARYDSDSVLCLGCHSGLDKLYFVERDFNEKETDLVYAGLSSDLLELGINFEYEEIKLIKSISNIHLELSKSLRLNYFDIDVFLNNYT